MPNIKSAKKRVLVNQKKNERNRVVKSQISTAVKKLKAAVAANNAEEAVALHSQAVAVIDSAAGKNVIHKNSASRKKANLAKLLNTLKK